MADSRSFSECFKYCIIDHASNDLAFSLLAAVIALCGPAIPIPKNILPEFIMPRPGLGKPSKWTGPGSIIDRLLDEARRRGYIKGPKPGGGIFRRIGRFLAKRACPVAMAAYASYLAGGAASCSVLCAIEPN